MAAIQTAVSDMAVAYAGMLSGIEPTVKRSYINEEASTEMPFGVMVKQGTSFNECKLMAAQADVANSVGVVLHSHAYAKDNELGDTGLKRYATANVLREGEVVVYVSEAVAVGGAVRVRADANAGAGALLGPGTFCTTASATHTVLLTKGARWMKGTSGAGFARLRVDLDSLAVTNDA